MGILRRASRDATTRFVKMSFAISAQATCARVTGGVAVRRNEGMKSSFSGARVVQKDVVKLARKQVATVAAVSVPEGVTIEKMGKVRLETRKPFRRGTFHSPREVSSPAGRHPRRGSGRRRG